MILDIYIRAWVPTWGAVRGDDGILWPQPKVDYPMWFIGHTVWDALSDAALDAHIKAALIQGIEDTDDFYDYLGQQGYVTFKTGGTGQVYVANLPE